MKIVGQKEEIFGAFKTAGKVLTQAAGKTIPQEIKVECLEDGTIRLFATDLERSIRCVKKSDKISVEVPGPPPVAEKMAAKARRAIIVRNMRTTITAGQTMGKIT